MCLVVATGVLISLLFTITIRCLYQGGKIEQLDWDMATVTAGDYTVEFEIPKEAYEEWYNNEYMPGEDRQNGVSPAFALKTKMI